MANFEASIDVNATLRDTYNQWTQFETFPKFMDSVERIEQITDTKMRWYAEIGGVDKEWDAVITEQIPDTRIAWTSIEGAKNAGVVTFHHIDDNTTRVMLQVDYEPEGFVESVGAAVGIVNFRLKDDLDRFKRFIESREDPTGAWRGTVEQEAE